MENKLYQISSYSGHYEASTRVCMTRMGSQSPDSNCFQQQRKSHANDDRICTTGD